MEPNRLGIITLTRKAMLVRIPCWGCLSAETCGREISEGSGLVLARAMVLSRSAVGITGM